MLPNQPTPQSPQSEDPESTAYLLSREIEPNQKERTERLYITHRWRTDSPGKSRITCWSESWPILDESVHIQNLVGPGVHPNKCWCKPVVVFTPVPLDHPEVPMSLLEASPEVPQVVLAQVIHRNFNQRGANVPDLCPF